MFLQYHLPSPCTEVCNAIYSESRSGLGTGGLSSRLLVVEKMAYVTVHGKSPRRPNVVLV